MASLKTKLNNSLQFRLSVWLSIVILITAMLAGAFSFIATFKDVNEIQDDLLRQIASLFDAEHLPAPHHGDDGRLSNSDEESRVVVQYLNAKPSANQSRDEILPLMLPATLPDGIQTIEVENESYRVLVKTIMSGERIAIAQETGIRDEIAEAGAIRTLLPFLILLPVLLLTVAILVYKLFKPVKVLSSEIDLRSEQDLHPFQVDNIALEIKPFIIAINRLLKKVLLSMNAQRRFIADAAHELRSPLTALSLQAEHLANAEMPNAAKERVSMLQKGLERNRHLLNQLLEFSRLQSTAPANKKTISIKRIYRDVLEDLHALAEVKRIDIGVTDSDDVELIADETDLTILIRNLVDNAIRYIPDGGKIDLSVKRVTDRVQLTITDSGPGILLEHRLRVMDPFYRIIGGNEIGSGLGLSIVKEVVSRMGGEIQLEFADKVENTGLVVIVILDNY